MLDPAQRVFFSIVAAGILTQAIKILLSKLHGHHVHAADLVVTGGMPSTHSALVTALALSIYFTEGMTTTFLVAAALTAIVLRDALGVRRTAGEEGKIINQLITKTKLEVNPLHYSLGHTPAEVAVGVIIGLMTSVIPLFI